ncbi:autophagy-related protein 16-1 isoform X2 [Labrus bergylta]|uniref:autophagy-related protein 16-1 isoform X2 n=1 Tax=Labrus bergylta TaxID=56723 RepID=UPI0009B418C4|nr:autophagy-related protein 16-1-like isoform X2 [Labrus bergylta]
MLTFSRFHLRPRVNKQVRAGKLLRVDLGTFWKPLSTRDESVFTTMSSWRNHVRTSLQQRDRKEKIPYAGVFTCLSQLEERYEIRKHILDDVLCKSLGRGGVDVGKDSRLLQLQLRESEHMQEKLSQTVSDLTTVLYLKEAELQYRQARVSLFRQEALSLARRSNTQRASLSELEHTLECQSKELADLHEEVRGLKKALAEARREKEELLQRWMVEKRVEADRLNKYNDTQERWQRLAKQLKKQLRIEIGKEYAPIVTNTWNGINNTSEIRLTHSDSEHVSTVTQV